MPRMDTYKAVKTLKGAGFPEDQAEALVDVVGEEHEELATKSDLAAIREVMATKADLAAVRAEMATKDDLAAVRAEMATKDDLAAVRAEMTAMRAEMATKDDIAAVYQVMATKEDIASVRAEMATKAEVRESEYRMTIRLGGIVVVAATLIVAIQGLLLAYLQGAFG